MKDRQSSGEARLAKAVMPLTARLRHYCGMVVVDVRDNPAGTVFVLSPVGHMSSRRVLVMGITDVVEIPDPPYKRDDDQAQVDIGDDMYERQRYDEQDIDVGREPQ